jgi:hypothetical protein
MEIRSEHVNRHSLNTSPAQEQLGATLKLGSIPILLAQKTMAALAQTETSQVFCDY